MGNRSNINLVGNTTQGQNVGAGEGVYKDKILGNTLQFKGLAVTGTTMAITCDADNIYFSAATGSGGGSGFTISNNGLCDNGSTTVGLGGTLSDATTTIDGGGNSLSLPNLSGMAITGTSFFAFRLCSTSGNAKSIQLDAQNSTIELIGCQATRLEVGNNIDFSAVTGTYCFRNLPAKSAETDVLYVDGNGKISCGAAAGGSSLAGCTTGVGTYMTVLGCNAQGTSAVCSTAIGEEALCNATGCENVVVGLRAGLGIVAGQKNVAVGTFTMQTGGTGGGSSNVALGYQALCNGACANYNIAIGSQAMSKCVIAISGQRNIGIGDTALSNIVSGTHNVAIGTFASCNATTAISSIAIGDAALVNNTNGHRHIAIGACALCSITGSTGVYGNIAIGANAGNGINCCDALYNILIGHNAASSMANATRNIFIGDTVAPSKTTGNDNILIGYRASNNLTTGALNVMIGCGVGFNVTGDNNLIIGYSPSTHLIRGCFSDNTICNGANNTAWNTSSDSRIKENVTGITNAVSILSQLNPVTFDYTTGYTTFREWDENRRVCDYGFVAQEFETVFPQYVSCAESYISSGSTVSDFRTMNSGHLIPVLVKAIQELEARIAALEG